jgi:hypothetical protein
MTIQRSLFEREAKFLVVSTFILYIHWRVVNLRKRENQMKFYKETINNIYLSQVQLK